MMDHVSSFLRYWFAGFCSPSSIHAASFWARRRCATDVKTATKENRFVKYFCETKVKSSLLLTITGNRIAKS